MSDYQVISVQVAARLLMISERRVQQLAKAKWIPKPYHVVGVVQGYLKFLADEKSRANKSAGQEEIARQRARKLQFENDAIEKITVTIEDTLAAIDAVIGVIKSDLASIPVRITDDIALRRRIEDNIDGVLAGIAQRCQKAIEDLATGRDALGAVAEDDAESMGEGE